MTLPTLTDRDIMMNLWLGLIIVLEDAGIDAAQVTQSLCQMAPTPATHHQGVSLADIIAETERRLDISQANITTEEIRPS